MDESFKIAVDTENEIRQKMMKPNTEKLMVVAASLSPNRQSSTDKRLVNDNNSSTVRDLANDTEPLSDKEILKVKEKLVRDEILFLRKLIKRNNAPQFDRS